MGTRNPSPSRERTLQTSQVDIDSYDAEVLESLLYHVTPLVIVCEYLWAVPPPYLYKQMYAAAESSETSFYSASISFYVALFARFGYSLYRMNGDNAVWPCVCQCLPCVVWE